MNRTFLKLITACLLVIQQSQCGLITTVNNVDPQPLFTAHYPNSFLTWAQKAHLHGIDAQPYYNRVNWSVMPFFQRANRGTDIFGNHQALLGDLTGTINVLATLPFNVSYTGSGIGVTLPPGYPSNTYQDIPCGYAPYPLLEQIRATLLSDVQSIFGNVPGNVPPLLRSVQQMLELQQATTPSNLKNVGSLEADIRYRKYGVRFNAETYLFAGFGVVFCGGFSSIDQAVQLNDTTLGAFNGNNLSANYPIPVDTTASLPNVITIDQWHQVLSAISRDVVAKATDIGIATGQKLNSFTDTSVEDVNIDLFWRGLFRGQKLRQIIPGQAPDVYSSFCLMPFASIGGTIAAAKDKDYTQVFSVPFGNNGHNAVRARAGVAIDFYETIEVTGEFGFTHFSARTIGGLPIPTNLYQNGMYPYAHAAYVQPGNNVHLGLGIYAYHFSEMVSAYCTYVYINHNEDKITLNPLPTTIYQTNAQILAQQCNTDAFKPQLLAAKSPWRAQVINASLCVDLSPSARGLLLVQIPVSRRNAYRSTTWGLSLEIGF